MLQILFFQDKSNHVFNISAWRHFPFFFVYVGVLGLKSIPLGEIVSLHEAQQCWRALANVTWAAIDMGVNSPSIHPFSVTAYPCTLGHGGRSEPILARVNSQWGEFHFWVNYLVVNCLLLSLFFLFLFFSKSLNTSLQHKNFTPIKKSFRMRRKNIIPVKAEFLFQCQSFTVDILFIYFILSPQSNFAAYKLHFTMLGISCRF